MNVKEKLFSGGLWALAGKFIAIVCAFLLQTILARALSPTDYGAYTIVLNTVIILATAGNAGMDQIVIIFAASNKNSGHLSEVRTAIIRCAAIAASNVLLVSTALFFASGWLFGDVMHVPQVDAFIPWILLWIVGSTVQRQMAETFRGLGDMRSATLFGGIRNNGILLSVGTCLPMFVLLETKLVSLRSVFMVMAFVSLFSFLWAAKALMSELRRSARVDVPVGSGTGKHLSLSKALHEGWPLCLSMLVIVLNTQGTGWLAGAFDMPGRVALFGAAQRFAILLITPMVVANTIVPPIIVELHQRGEIKRLERVMQAVAGLTGIPCVLILIGLVLVGRPLLGFLYTPYYVAAYPLLLLLCLGQVVNIATGSWQIVLPMTGHKHEMALVSIFSLSLLAVTGVIGGHYSGVVGVAEAFCVSVVVANIVGMLVVRRKLGIWTFVHVNREILKEVFAMVRKRLKKPPAGNKPNTMEATK